MQTLSAEFYSLDTPSLLLDAGILESNIAAMAVHARAAGVALRPHSKTHKSPVIAQKQLEAGAIGITCQKLGEAEVMADAGIRGLLIASQVVGVQKISRLIRLAQRSDVTVAVDDPRNALELAAAAAQANLRLGVLVEVDIGMHRCGVQPGDETHGLVDLIRRQRGLEFRGVMGYEGHTVMIMDPNDRREKATQALSLLGETVDSLRSKGIEVPIVSSTGTGTFDIGAGFTGVTELQVGSYATMDGRYQQVGVPFQPALTVLATVISTRFPGHVVVDAGAKSISTDFGLPLAVGMPGVEAVHLSEEHGKFAIPPGTRLQIGERIELLPMHGCTTINLHDRYYVHRHGRMEDIWPIAGRGRSQ